MKIAVFAKSTSFHKGYGGLETQNKVLCEKLVERGNAVTVFSPKKELEFDTKDLNGVVYVFVPCKFKMGLVLGFGGRLNKNNWINKSYDTFKNYHEKNEYDLVLSQSSAALGIIKRKNELGVKIISIAHGSILGELKTYFKDISTISDYLNIIPNTAFAVKNFFTRQREYVLGSDRVIAVSNAVKNSLLEETFAPDEKIVVVHNGINPQNCDESKKGHGTVNLIYVGKMIRSKGVFNLINVLAGTQFADIKLHMVGGGRDLEELKKYSNSKHLSEKIVFYGNISPEEVVPLMFKNDIFVMPTLRIEGFPMTLVEAMFAGLPIVANNIGGNSDAVLDGETGFLTDPENLNDFREKLVKLVKDKELIHKMSLKARERANSEFTTDIMVNKYESIFNEVLR